ncbi:MAG: hypothetical protein HWN65_21015, partial [Candidatus Helarchaeota archaeon]|nr:hypothetical protein [Candidatus Helarchaeota archaeon]
MNNRKKGLLVMTFIAAFVMYMIILPGASPKAQNVETSAPFHAKDGKTHTDLELKNNITSYYNDTFKGFLKINNSVVTFNNCSFLNYDYLEIYGSSNVTFLNSCKFDVTYPFRIYDNANVTITDATLATTSSIEMYDANATIANSTFEFSSMAIHGSANVSFSQCDLIDPPGETNAADEDGDAAGDEDDNDQGDDDDQGDDKDNNEAGNHTLKIHGNAIVTSDKCYFNLSSLEIYENAEVTFSNCDAVNGKNITAQAISIKENAVVTGSACNFMVTSTSTFALHIQTNATSTQFSGCTFNLTIDDPRQTKVALKIGGTGTTHFLDCPIINASSIRIEENATVEFKASTVAVSPYVTGDDPLIPSAVLALHRFKFIGNATITCNNAYLACPWDSELEAWDTVTLKVFNDSTVNADYVFKILMRANVTIEDSRVTTGVIGLVHDDGWYNKTGMPPNDANLTLIGSIVNGAIVDLGTNTRVTLQNSTVDIITETLWINGTITLSNNTITSGSEGGDYSSKNFTADGNSNYNSTQHVVIGLNGSSISIESSQIYIAIAAGDSEMNISGSTITDYVTCADHANGTITDSIILGKEQAAWYGSVGGFQYSYFRQDYSNTTSYSFISLTNCTSFEKIRPLSEMTLTFNNCSLDLTLLDISGTANCTFFNKSVIDANSVQINGSATVEFAECEISGQLFLKGSATTNFSSSTFTSTSLEIANTTCTTFHALVDFLKSDISGEILLSNQTTLVLQHATYETIGYLNDTMETLVVVRSGPEINVSGLIKKTNETQEEILSANLTINDAEVPPDPNDPLHFTIDPVTHQIPGLASFEIVAYNNTGYDGNKTKFARNFTIEIPADAPLKNVVWDTTSDFANYANNNCSIGTNNVTLTWVNATGIAYDFTNDSDGSNPAGWFVWEGPNTHMNVYAGVEDHAKVVEINDSATANTCYMINTFGEKANGTVEFWLRSTAEWSGRLFITFRYELFPIFRLDLRDNGELRVWGPFDGTIMSSNWADDQWYHVRVEFNCTTDKFKVWLDGTYQDEYDFYYSSSYIEDIRIEPIPDSTTGYFYLDAIDYSWAGGYYPERSYYTGHPTGFLENGTWTSNVTDLEDPTPYHEKITFSCDSTASTAVLASYRMSNDGSSWVSYNGSAWET